jgi:hypothetical protein
MQLSDNDDTPVPLLKDKKPRPPMTEKQMANFAKAREVRAQNIKAKKEEKVLQAQRALLEKEGLRPVKQEEEQDDEPQMTAKALPKKLESSKTPKPSAPKTPAPLLKEEKKMPPQKIKAKAPVVVEESSSEEEETESSSEEEIIVVKRKKKAPKKAKTNHKISIEGDYDSDEDEGHKYVAPRATASFHDYFV